MKIVELIVCLIGIYTCFLTWGITQERVTTTEYKGRKFKYFWFLNAVQAIAASIIGFIYIQLKGDHLSPLTPALKRSFLSVTLLTTISPQFGYAALKHIDYPTLILGKSCKLVPLMLMNFVLYRKTFPLYQYVVVALITGGVSSFMLFNSTDKSKPNETGNSMFGILLLSTNLLLDGITNSSQDQIFRKHKISGTSMMVYMNLLSSTFMIVYLLLGPYLISIFSTFELWDAINFGLENPGVVVDIMIFAICGAVGQCFIYHTLSRFGSLLLVTINVTRKMFSILLSAFWFKHVFNFGQWVSVGVVFFGIFVESYMKSSSRKVENVSLKEKKLKKIS